MRCHRRSVLLAFLTLEDILHLDVLRVFVAVELAATPLSEDGKIWGFVTHARVVELAYTTVLEAVAERRAGSSPVPSTTTTYKS
jgi:hypothetical protein